MPETTLYFFTNSYPYKGETFVGNEIKALSAYYTKIKLFSTHQPNEIKEVLPQNVELINIDDEVNGKFGLLFSNFFLVAKIFGSDLIRNSDKKNVIKKFKYNLSLLLKTLAQSERLNEIIKSDNSQKRFVAFWMDQWTLNLSILKYKKKISEFVFRVHQHDLYIDENPTQYIPFRFFNMKMATAVFPDSQRGVKFLKDLNFYPEKIHIGHLGVIDKGDNPFSDKEFVMVSCSALVARKRVDLIAEVLNLIDIPVTWIHFGSKGEDKNAFDKLKERCLTLPKNIKPVFMGEVDYGKLIEFYQKNPVNLFITLSRAEGLPVSVIEAVSFGIPVLATDVMGLPDVVTEESGVIISPDLEKQKIAETIKEIASGNKNTPEFRSRVKNFWKTNFNAELNYSKFNLFLNNN